MSATLICMLCGHGHLPGDPCPVEGCDCPSASDRRSAPPAPGGEPGATALSGGEAGGGQGARSFGDWLAGLDWVATLYDGIETAWSAEDGAYLARWSRGNGLLHWVMTDGETREQAVRHLVEMAPDIMLTLHGGEDEALQKWRVLNEGVIEGLGGKPGMFDGRTSGEVASLISLRLEEACNVGSMGAQHDAAEVITDLRARLAARASTPEGPTPPAAPEEPAEMRRVETMLRDFCMVWDCAPTTALDRLIHEWRESAAGAPAGEETGERIEGWAEGDASEYFAFYPQGGVLGGAVRARPATLILHRDGRSQGSESA